MMETDADDDQLLLMMSQISENRDVVPDTQDAVNALLGFQNGSAEEENQEEEKKEEEVLEAVEEVEETLGPPKNHRGRVDSNEIYISVAVSSAKALT